MNKSSKGLGFYLLIILGVVCLTFFLNNLWMDNNDYRTYEDYRKDMEDGNIVIVEIQKNAEVPTGILEVTLKNGEVKDLYVSDTSKEARDRKSVV